MSGRSAAENPASGRRAAFLDFDGTYAEHGVVPPEHVAAVRQARAHGHAVLLCTGRPPSIVTGAIAEVFDGVVGSAGAHVRIGEEVLRDERFPAALGRRAIDVLEDAGAAFTLESAEALHCSPGSQERVRRSLTGVLRSIGGSPSHGQGSAAQENARTILAALDSPADLREVPFAKITVWDSPVPMEELAARIGPEIGALPNSVEPGAPASGELHLRAIDKADGVRIVAEFLGMEMSETVGIGDGMNDLGMLRVAGTAVAIAGSRPEVLALADLTVPGPAEHGIVRAFEQLGMLDGPAGTGTTSARG